MYVRRPYLPQVNKGRGSAFPGFLHGWSSLSDAERWATMVYLNDLQAPVPHETVNRTIKQRDFHIHFAPGRSGLACGWESCGQDRRPRRTPAA